MRAPPSEAASPRPAPAPAPSRSGRLAYRGAKRALDVLLSGAGLLLLSPLLAGAALAVKLSSPGPVLFRQERLGRGGFPLRS